MEDDAQTLHKEWRAIVLAKLSSLEVGQEGIKNEFISMKLHSVSIEEYRLLQERVKELEELKSKALAIWGVIQVLTVFVGWLISLLMK